MDFVTASLVGGLIYDIFKGGITEYATCVNVALKDLLLTDAEKALIIQDFSTATEEDKSSKENLENFFENRAQNTRNIVNKYKNQVNQIHYGIGDNKTYATTGTHIENQVINNTLQSIDPKKS